MQPRWRFVLVSLAIVLLLVGTYFAVFNVLNGQWDGLAAIRTALDVACVTALCVVVPMISVVGLACKRSIQGSIGDCSFLAAAFQVPCGVALSRLLFYLTGGLVVVLAAYVVMRTLQREHSDALSEKVTDNYGATTDALVQEFVTFDNGNVTQAKLPLLGWDVSLHRLLEWWILSWTGAASLWSLSYFVYWYTRVLDLSWEVLEWLSPVVQTGLLLLFIACINLTADGERERVAKLILCQVPAAGSEAHSLLQLRRLEAYHWTFKLLGFSPHLGLVLMFVTPQVVGAAVKALIEAA